MGCIIAVTLSSIGDDDYNLILNDSRWYFFHEPLIITFLFLFIRSINSERNTFNKRDFLFFLPYILFVFIESLSNLNNLRDNTILEVSNELIEVSFIGMLLYSIYDIIKHKKAKWLLAFVVPFAVFFISDELTKLFSISNKFALPFDSYGLFLIAVFLFYYVTYKLIVAPKDILPVLENKYKSSNLANAEVESIINELNKLMNQNKLFKNQKLNVAEVATHLGISRQQLSEVLNVHMGIRFQDFLNQHRVEEFINCLSLEQYKNFTLFGLATEVGFSSKSSFNSTFKKLKGITPSQYKKQNLV